MGGECGVVSAAVLGMEHQRHVEDFGFKLCIFAVVAQHIENVLRSGEVLFWAMDYKSVAVNIVTLGVVAVNHKQGEQRDQFK